MLYNSTVDFDTTYGEFTLQMDLFKTRMFDGGEKFSTRPIVTIDEEVCISELYMVLRCDSSVPGSAFNEVSKIL